jgi:hypothetical protein
MNFYDEAIEAKHQLQLDLVRKRKTLLDLVRQNKSVQEIATPRLIKGVLYDHDISVLEDADPYFWEPRITQLVLATGQQLPNTVSFDLSWLHGKAGYWWFGRSSPLIGVSKAGERKYVNALLWNMHPNGSVSVETFHVVGRDQYPLGSLTWDEGENLANAIARAGTIESELVQMPDLVLRELAIGLSRKVESLASELINVAGEAKNKHEEVVALSKQLGYNDQYDASKYDLEITAHQAKKRLDEAQTERFTAEYRERLSEWTEASRAALQLFACGSLWLKQKITTVSQAPLTRAAERRLKRAEISTKCLVVELRSKSYVKTTADEERHQVDWAWQWAVRGHWRDQPTKDGYKLIWIHPFIKGPEDKPLKPDAARVFAVTR